MADPTTGLVAGIKAAGAPLPPWEPVTVTALVAGTPARVTVNYDGAEVTIPRLKAYAPVVGEVAVCGRIGAGLFAIGGLG